MLSDAITTPLTPSSKSPSRGLTVNVRMPDGGWVAAPALAGERLTAALAAFGLTLRGTDGGNSAALPCSARIPAAWLGRLDPPSGAEVSTLARLVGAADSSRLLYHLVMTSELDGLELVLDWDALEPQTYWIAG